MTSPIVESAPGDLSEDVASQDEVAESQDEGVSAKEGAPESTNNVAAEEEKPAEAVPEEAVTSDSPMEVSESTPDLASAETAPVADDPAPSAPSTTADELSTSQLVNAGVEEADGPADSDESLPKATPVEIEVAAEVSERGPEVAPEASVEEKEGIEPQPLGATDEPQVPQEPSGNSSDAPVVLDNETESQTVASESTAAHGSDTEAPQAVETNVAAEAMSGSEASTTAEPEPEHGETESDEVQQSAEEAQSEMAESEKHDAVQSSASDFLPLPEDDSSSSVSPVTAAIEDDDVDSRMDNAPEVVDDTATEEAAANDNSPEPDKPLEGDEKATLSGSERSPSSEQFEILEEVGEEPKAASSTSSRLRPSLLYDEDRLAEQLDYGGDEDMVETGVTRTKEEEEEEEEEADSTAAVDASKEREGSPSTTKDKKPSSDSKPSGDDSGMCWCRVELLANFCWYGRVIAAALDTSTVLALSSCC